MFLLLILFGLLALGLAFVTYWQADVQGTSRPLDPPGMAARKSDAPKAADPGAAEPGATPGVGQPAVEDQPAPGEKSGTPD